MKIVNSDLSLSSTHTLWQQEEQTETMRFWQVNRPMGPDSQAIKLTQHLNQDNVEISDTARALQTRLRALHEVNADGDSGVLSSEDQNRIQLIQDFVYALTGKRIKITVLQPSDLAGGEATADGQSASIAASSSPSSSPGWGLVYTYQARQIEQEQTTFHAAGVVQTADGRQISLDLDVSLSRTFMAEQNISVKAGEALIDPLVIDFAGPTASLTTTNYNFDLDSDGLAEQISFVGPGSGFLALDKNGDGKISDGGELFGPESGSGFDELSTYDTDGNGWIDETDPIYDRLRIWVKDEVGNDRLFALGQKGVGAIYLGNIDSQFALKDSDNRLRGELQSSGLFLREDGSVGLIQQIDLAV